MDTRDRVRNLYNNRDYFGIADLAERYIAQHADLLKDEVARRIAMQDNSPDSVSEVCDAIYHKLKLAVTDMIAQGEFRGILRFTGIFEKLGLIYHGKEFRTDYETCAVYKREPTGALAVGGIIAVRSLLYVTTGELTDEPDLLVRKTDSLYVLHSKRGTITRRPWSYGTTDNEAEEIFFQFLKRKMPDQKSRRDKAKKEVEGRRWDGFRLHEFGSVCADSLYPDGNMPPFAFSIINSVYSDVANNNPVFFGGKLELSGDNLTQRIESCIPEIEKFILTAPRE